MAEPTHIGRVFIWGLDGTLAYTGMATGANEPTDLTYKDDVSRHNSKDKKGETIGVKLFDPNPKITIKFMPCHTATGAGAVANARSKMVLPTKGARVTLAGFPPDTGSSTGTINGTTWLYLGGGEIGLNNEKEVEITLPLEKFNTDLAVDNS